jgi:hypothetical protein
LQHEIFRAARDTTCCVPANTDLPAANVGPLPVIAVFSIAFTIVVNVYHFKGKVRCSPLYIKIACVVQLDDIQHHVSSGKKEMEVKRMIPLFPVEAMQACIGAMMQRGNWAAMQ